MKRELICGLTIILLAMLSIFCDMVGLKGLGAILGISTILVGFGIFFYDSYKRRKT